MAQRLAFHICAPMYDACAPGSSRPSDPVAFHFANWHAIASVSNVWGHVLGPLCDVNGLNYFLNGHGGVSPP